MPQLPSGRHVAIHVQPALDVLENAGDSGNVHLVMDMTTRDSLAPYVCIYYLVPESEADHPLADQLFRDDALPRPPGFVAIDSGYRLSQFKELSAEWSEADKQAFWHFIDARGQAMFNEILEQAAQVQKRLLDNSGATARMLALWHKAGVHPAQEKGWAESDPGGTNWDSYDMLAALGQLTVVIPQHPEIVKRLGTAHDRLQGAWMCMRDIYRIPEGWPDSQKNVRECANMARSAGWLATFPENKQQWLHDQCVIECVNIWSAYGDGFRADFPRQFGIIELVVVSPEAKQYFRR